MIILKNIYFNYEDREVIKNFSASFASNETHLIIGPNGAGKTTLAFIIKGLIKPTQGRVLATGSKIGEWRKKMGLLFQFPENLFFNDTVYDEIAYGAKRFEIEDIDRKINNIADFLGLDRKILNLSPFELSYGEKRMVSFASILIWEPSYLILDEPFSGLDWQFKNRLSEVIESLKGRFGVVIVSQELDNVISFAERVSLIENGELTFSSPTEETDWERVYEAGCDIPSGVRLAKKLKEKGIRLNSDVRPYTIQGLVDLLKK